MDRHVVFMMSSFVLFLAFYPSVFVQLVAGLFSDQHVLSGPAASAHTLHTTVAEQRIPDLFHHLGGNGPWIPKINGTVDGGIEPPDGCRVTQVHMVSAAA